jgi:hypothetical protein
VQTLAEFIAKQNEAYANFRRLAEETRRTGLRLDPYFGKYTGFYVNLSHSSEVAQHAAAFSHGLSEIIPCTSYDAENVHTTLASSAALAEGFRVDPESDEHSAMLENLSLAAREAVHVLGEEQVQINFNQYLHTDVVAIAAGEPNEAFVKLVVAVVSAANRRGVQLKPAWGAQMTLARFTNAVPADKLSEFYRFMEVAPVPGRSTPTHVNVGYNAWSWNAEDPNATHGGHFVPHLSIPLRGE